MTVRLLEIELKPYTHIKNTGEIFYVELQCTARITAISIQKAL